MEFTADCPNGALIRNVEDLLAGFYGFAPCATAADHLINRQELADHGDPLPDPARGGVLVDDRDKHLFIGLFIHDAIFTLLQEKDPLTRLDGENIDAFSVLVEEISQFHLILNRVMNRQGVSRVELEWQGEIDKVLLSAHLLRQQSGDSHLNQLYRLFYFAAETGSASHYQEASHLAGIFWRRLSERPGLLIILLSQK